MQAQCRMYNQCSDEGKQNLHYSTDTNSLYARKINDNQTVNRRCYEKHPINIIEGFGNTSIFNILLWIVGICILIVAAMYLMEKFNMKKVKLTDTVMKGQSGGGCPMSDTFNMTDGGTLNLNGGGMKLPNMENGDLLDFLFSD